MTASALTISCRLLTQLLRTGNSMETEAFLQASQQAEAGAASSIGPAAIPDDSRLRPIRRDLARAVDSLPELPAHLQHMAERPWVMAMQLRWVRANLVEEKLEKEQ